MSADAGRDIEGCRSCGSPRLKPFLSLGEMPRSDGFTPTRETALDAPRAPLDVAFCEDCALVQILRTLPPETLFGDDYVYLSSVSDTVVANARDNVRARLEEERLGADSLVVELASNDGYLLRGYRDAGVPVLGIDPSPVPCEAARAAGIETIQAFFGRELGAELAAQGRRADVVHASNVLAHVADTNGFVAGIAALLKPQGVAVIEFPYLRDLIESGEFDTIYHEHLCYFSVIAVQALLARHGLELARVDRIPIHGGSLRIFARPRGACAPDPAVEAMAAEERALGLDRFEHFAGFAARVSRATAELREMLSDLRAKGFSVAAYGAAAKGTILLNAAGLGPDLVDFVADRNPRKQGRFVPGAGLPIVGPERIEQARPDFLLILPWNMKEEIIAQQAAHAARGGRFIVPVPEARVLAGTAAA